MLKTIAIIFIIAIVSVLIFVATKPDTVRVQRAASIKAGLANLKAAAEK